MKQQYYKRGGQLYVEAPQGGFEPVAPPANADLPSRELTKREYAAIHILGAVLGIPGGRVSDEERTSYALELTDSLFSKLDAV